MADAYDEICRYLVPAYDLMQEELVRILRFVGMDRAVVVDLGAGSGILIERILASFPHAFGYCIDYSDDFLRVARRRLGAQAHRVYFIHMSFKDEWESKLKHTPDVIVSMSAIHHLEDQDKERLYRRCFEALGNGGWFFNIDEMKSVNEQAYINSMHYWIDHVRRAGEGVPSAKKAYYEEFAARFENWKRRNVENLNEPKREGDDLHASFLEQIAMLERAGFSGVDVFVKYHLWCMIGGKKAG
jgi:trans-aconitate methyltransferase